MRTPDDKPFARLQILDVFALKLSSEALWSRLMLWLTLGFLVFYGGLTRGHLISPDEVQVYQATRSLWLHGVPASTLWHGRSVPGRGGYSYGAVSSGQPILALPLFACGHVVDVLCDDLHHQSWSQLWAGLPEASEGGVTSGEPEIFFVNLFNAGLTSLLCAVFLAFNLRLGVAPRWALLATLAMGLGSYIAGYSSSLFTQTAESLGLLWCFYFLFKDACVPDRGARFWAGTIGALTFLCRYPALLMVPFLLLYHGRVVLARAASKAQALVQLLPFSAMLAAGLVLHAADQYWKMGTIYSLASYAHPQFDTPWSVSLSGFLLSPGDSIFLYTPLLVLAPCWFLDFRRRWRREAIFIMVTFAAYLLTCGKFHDWHGLLCYGPRYLAAVTPLLMLPLGGWLERASNRQRWLALLLAGLGIVVQLAYFAVNYLLVCNSENVFAYHPVESFLWVPAKSPIYTHLRALGSMDERVDTFLVRTYRDFGGLAAGSLLAGWTLLLTLCAWRVVRLFRRLPDNGVADFSGCLGPARAFLLLAWLATACLRLADSRVSGPDPEARLLDKATHSLYGERDPNRAITYLHILLQRNPQHYRAHVQLAQALEAAIRSNEARDEWQIVDRLAFACQDSATRHLAEERIATLAPRTQAALSGQGRKKKKRGRFFHLRAAELPAHPTR